MRKSPPSTLQSSGRPASPSRRRSGMAFGKMPKDYKTLTMMLPLRPIHDKADLENATEAADAMAGHDLTRDQEDYFDVLTTLIEQYESENLPQPVRQHDPLGNLKFLMEQHGMVASDLGRILGQRELGSKILRAERELSKTHIRLLAEHFHVSAAMFI